VATPPDSPKERFDEIAVREVMHRGLLSCPADTPLNEVAELMIRESIHCVLVAPVDDEVERGRWRIVSDLDLVSAASEPWSTAGEISTTPTVTVSESDRVSRAAALMSEYQSAHLIVVDALAAPVGVVSTLDIADAMSSDDTASVARDRS
jgi:CBS domain-containing protein